MEVGEVTLSKQVDGVDVDNGEREIKIELALRN